jgi:hypothetical protein
MKTTCGGIHSKQKSAQKQYHISARDTKPQKTIEKPAFLFFVMGPVMQ